MRYRNYLLTLLMVLILSVSYAGEEKSITILHTNDIHSRFVTAYNKHRQEVCGGIIRQSGVVNTVRNKVGTSSTLLLDAGDLSQGTAYFSVFKGRANFIASKLIGFDAMTTGNHEYDNGIPFIKELVEEAGNRLLCCSLTYNDTGKSVFQPYHVFVRNGIKIGVIGCIGVDGWSSIDKTYKANITHTPQILSVGKYAKKIRPYVDLVVVLSHSGIDEDKELAAQLGEIDVIVGGHTHTYLEKPVFVKNNEGVGGCVNELNGTIIVQTGEWSVNVGRLDLKFNNHNRLCGYDGCLIKAEAEHESYASKAVVDHVKYYEKKLNDMMDTVIANSKYGIPHIIKGNRNQPVAVGQYVSEGMRWLKNSDIAISNTGMVKIGLEKGNIKKADIYEVAPYDNTVVLISMKGKELKKALDAIAEGYGKYEGFQYAGIKVDFNIKNKIAENILIDGKPIDPNKTYVIATTSFMAKGNDFGDVVYKKVEKIEDTGVMVRDAVIQYSEATKELPDYREPNYRFIK